MYGTTELATASVRDAPGRSRCQITRSSAPVRSVHLRKPLRIAALFVLGGLVLGLLPGRAYADPTAAEIEAQIDKVWQQAEPLIEEYNGVHERYQQNKVRQNELQKKIAPLEQQVDLSRARVGALAAQMYRSGPTDSFQAIITSGSIE